MAGIRFSHSKVGELNLRLPPTEVAWSYTMNTNTTNTYGGQVVQILSVSFDKVVFSGRFGKEGAHGKELVREDGHLILKDRPRSSLTSWNSGGKYGVGLSQMTEFFRTYFQAASQGSDTRKINYDQEPVRVRYEGALNIPVDVNKTQQEWKVYPISFPSYKRTNQDFAPEWMVECEIAEAPFSISGDEYADLFNDDVLRKGVGWRVINPFSDPQAQFLTDKSNAKQIEEAVKKVNDLLYNISQYYRDMVPAITPEALEELILSGGSLPNIYNQNGLGLNRNADNTPRTSSSSGGGGGSGVAAGVSTGTGVAGGIPATNTAVIPAWVRTNAIGRPGTYHSVPTAQVHKNGTGIKVTKDEKGNRTVHWTCK